MFLINKHSHLFLLDFHLLCIFHCSWLFYLFYSWACGLWEGWKGTSIHPIVDPKCRHSPREGAGRNLDPKYLWRYKLGGATDREAFKSKIPVVTYEDLQLEIQRIVNGDRSPILPGHPISEFLTGCVFEFIIFMKYRRRTSTTTIIHRFQFMFCFWQQVVRKEKALRIWKSSAFEVFIFCHFFQHYVFIFAVFFYLFGCWFVDCYDALFKRRSKPTKRIFLERVFNFSIGAQPSSKGI